jgi:hypothetical protein
MSAVPTNVGVFFGHVDKRANRWYWADTQSGEAQGSNPRTIRDMRHEIKGVLRERLGRRD